MAIDEEETKLKGELEDLKNQIKQAQQNGADKTLSDVCGDMGNVPKIQLRAKRIMKGHLSKVNDVHFSGDNRHVVSCSLDGKLIVWDTWTGNKVQIIPLQSSWVMSAAYSPSGNFVACGGMDNMCTVYDLNNKDNSGVAKIRREMAGFEGFLSCCRFLEDNKIVTGSADMKIILWNLEKGVKEKEFYGHEGDVMSMSLHPDKNSFITGSVDRTIKFHTSGYVFGSSSDDKTARLFDIRADQQIGLYKPPTPNSGFTSCGLSTSGRLIICGSDDMHIHVWDTVRSDHNGTLSGHENRITSLTMPDNGMAVVTSSWDTSVRVWN